MRGKCKVKACAPLKVLAPGAYVLHRIGFRVAARALRDLPLARIDLPSRHLRLHWIGIQVVHDDLQMIRCSHRNQNAEAARRSRLNESPTDRVARIDMIADERDTAKSRALQLGVDEHRTRGVGYAIDPQTAFRVDPLPVRLRLQLRRVKPVEIFRISADLPGEGFCGSGCGLRCPCCCHQLFAPCISQPEHVKRIGADMRQRRRAFIHKGQQILLVAGPAICGPEHEVGQGVATGQVFIGLEVDIRPRNEPAVRFLLAVRQHSIHGLQHHLARLRRSVKKHHIECRMKIHVGAGLGPSPYAAFGHL